jgi:hypothetical protein
VPENGMSGPSDRIGVGPPTAMSLDRNKAVGVHLYCTTVTMRVELHLPYSSVDICP